jgi:2-methylcitrate dehydratase PrpD
MRRQWCYVTGGTIATAAAAPVASRRAADGQPVASLPESQVANAIAMAAGSDASFAVIRAKPVSQWKGLASALGAMNALFLARRGVLGPLPAGLSAFTCGLSRFPRRARRGVACARTTARTTARSEINNL